MPYQSRPLPYPPDHALRTALEAMDLRLQLLLRRHRKRRQLLPHHLAGDVAALRAHVATLSRLVDQERQGDTAPVP